MPLAILKSRATVGIRALEVSVEIHITHGNPNFSIVGLPETVVKESRDRVRSALINSGFDFPQQRITVNLAPADLPKEGGRFDLPIALGILAACGLIRLEALKRYEFAGELALSGQLKAFNGALLFSMATHACQRRFILPSVNAPEAAIPKGSEIYGAPHLLAVYRHLTGQAPLAREPPPLFTKTPPTATDLSTVIGQAPAKRALLIAASGGHHLLFIGPPGTGKTLLAHCLIALLPPLNDAEALEIAAIQSLAGQTFCIDHWQQRPFRAPHHTASSAALVGGGSSIRPGEISLAHHGVLFLDELPEFNRAVLEALREPLEAGLITISRASQQIEFPARFQLIAAMNPCPCGYANTREQPCRCSPAQIKRYQHRLSGPFLDRFDMHVVLKPLPHQALLQAHQNANLNEDTTANLKKHVSACRQRQWQRQQKLNNGLDLHELQRFCHLDPSGQQLLAQALTHWHLSARAVHRLLRLSRTIADFANCDAILPQHVAEALNYRCLIP